MSQTLARRIRHPNTRSVFPYFAPTSSSCSAARQYGVNHIWAAVLRDGTRQVALNRSCLEERQLLDKLHYVAQHATPPIYRIDSESELLAGQSRQIHYIDSRRNEKTAPVSGLK